MTTKTYTAVAQGKPYMMTVTPHQTPVGTAGVLITCACSTHKQGNRAIVATDKGIKFPKSRIHGYVTLANSPAGVLAAKQGKAWKA